MLVRDPLRFLQRRLRLGRKSFKLHNSSSFGSGMLPAQPSQSTFLQKNGAANLTLPRLPGNTSGAVRTNPQIRSTAKLFSCEYRKLSFSLLSQPYHFQALPKNPSQPTAPL